MLGNILPPYHSLQELNLDWILTKIKNMLRFLPDDGTVGQILRRTAHGAEWSDEQGAGGSVTSVNGMQGAVVLTKSDIGLGSVDDVQQYSATNPPPYPVTSVNSQTGAVTLSIPTDTSDLTNTAGFVDAAGAAAAAPVQSVNSQTGSVTLSIPTDTSELTNTAGFVDAAGAAAAAPVQSVNGQTGAVVITAGSASWGTPETITFPYTPTDDGLIFGYLAPTNSQTSYCFITEDGTAWARASSYAGSGYGMCFPARTGKQYVVALSANISSQTFRFIPFT